MFETILTTVTTLEPALAAIAEQISQRSAKAIAVGDQLLQAWAPLAERIAQIQAAKDGISPELWAQIVQDAKDADAAVEADAPKE
jgi:hypothetical protein